VVHLVEENRELEELLRGIADRVFIGDAADLRVVTAAGIENAPSVVLTTNSEATNSYLSVYCRRLNPDAHIVSRITHERNLEAIHRAGADFVLSYSSLGVRLVLSLLLGRELVMLGEGVDLFVVDVPGALHGKTLAMSGIGAKTGLNVIAIQSNGGILGNPGGATALDGDSQLIALGTSAQRREFERVFAS
jgi:Trk K+ transport system NAD-binding subunit